MTSNIFSAPISTRSRQAKEGFMTAIPSHVLACLWIRPLVRLYGSKKKKKQKKSYQQMGAYIPVEISSCSFINYRNAVTGYSVVFVPVSVIRIFHFLSIFISFCLLSSPSFYLDTIFRLSFCQPVCIALPLSLYPSPYISLGLSLSSLAIFAPPPPPPPHLTYTTSLSISLLA